MIATLRFPTLLHFPRGLSRDEKLITPRSKNWRENVARMFRAPMGNGVFAQPMGGAGAATFSPTSISGLVRWGDASTLGLANDDPVSIYTDLSGNALHLNGTLTTRPLYKTNIQNSRAAILFDGSNDYLISSGNVGISGAAARTVFWVGTTTQNVALCSVGWGAESNTNLFSLGRFNGWYVTGYNLDNLIAAADSNWHVHVVTYNGTTLQWYVDGASIGTATRTYATTNSALAMGKNLAGGVYLAGYMGEDGIYNVAISSVDRVTLTAYLGARWGITVV